MRKSNKTPSPITGIEEKYFWETGLLVVYRLEHISYFPQLGWMLRVCQSLGRFNDTEL